MLKSLLKMNDKELQKKYNSVREKAANGLGWYDLQVIAWIPAIMEARKQESLLKALYPKIKPPEVEYDPDDDLPRKEAGQL